MKRTKSTPSKPAKPVKPKPAKGTGPAVRCSHSALVRVGELTANPKNPNTHPPEQLKIYARILTHQGWRKAITVSKQSGLIVTGHGAWLTAKAEGWPTVPVDYQDFASPQDETAHMVADNRLPQLAEVDGLALVTLLETDLKEVIDLTGFSLTDADVPPPENPAPPKTVEENLKALEEIKAQRREGNEGMMAKTDTEFYLVIAYPTRAAKEAALRKLGLPEDERYLAPDNILLLPASRTPTKKPKASPPNKSGACG